MRRWQAGYEKLPAKEPAESLRGAAPEAVTFLDHLKRPGAPFAANPGALSHTASPSGAIDSEKTLL